MKPVFTLVLALVVLSVASGGVVAQENATDDDLDANLEGEECPEPETIDENTVLCEAYLNDDGNAILVFKSDELQRVTLTDSGAFMAGGEVPQRDVVLRSEGTNHVEWSVTQHDGFAGVSVSTGSTLYAVPLENRSTLIGGPWGANDVQLAAISSATGVGSVAIIVVIRTVLGRTEEPERVA
ncbi:hypothetical protein [Natronomonas amylolytica]|uniref:hypothetical protein n=1 Tax=Natronomonas amylolytica TaxID=3108498 RepID=UPI0030098747